jgi:hypothetical protein
MKNKVKLMGFNFEYLEDEKKYEILDFPDFPQETKQSKVLFNEIEKTKFYNRNILFPIKLDITQRVKELKYKGIENFTFLDLFDLIVEDKDRFLNTDTFFKVQLTYENKLCVISITYYTICENGTSKIDNIDELLEFIFVYYDRKKFTKKFKKNTKKIFDIPNEIEYIPVLPLQWLEYDECENLLYFQEFNDF